MADNFKKLNNVPVSRLFLALDNPRFDPVGAEAEAIARLCDKEDVYPLARDIVLHGTNPLENLALTPVDGSEDEKSGANYYVQEGNRRICAIKLLNDPDLAPASYRKLFEKLAEKWKPIRTLPAVVFYDENALKIWRSRLHNGHQGGVGRKDWNADQKSRHDGGSKNKTALALLDYAENEGMITAQQREWKLTTVQRFLSNPLFREAMGIDESLPDDLGRTRPKEEFDIIAKKFIDDLLDGSEVNSRKNKESINKYARDVASLPGVSTKRVASEPLVAEPIRTRRRSAAKAPKKPEKIVRLQYDDDIQNALDGLNNYKLNSIYHSVCSIDLEYHTPLIAIGVWCFLETLSSLAGRNDTVPLAAFFSKAKLSLYGFSADQVTLRGAIERIQQYGNTTKHHAVAATFNGDQLNNDLATLRGVILKAIAEAGKSPP